MQSAVRRLRAVRTLNTLSAAAAQREARVQAEVAAAAEALVAEVMAAAMAEEAERAAAAERERVLEDFRRTFAASKIRRRSAASLRPRRRRVRRRPRRRRRPRPAAAQLEARVQAERAAAAEAAEEARVQAERAAAAAAMEAEASRYPFGAPTLSSRAQRRRQNGAWAKKGKGKTIFPDSTPPSTMPTEASPYIPGSGSSPRRQESPAATAANAGCDRHAADRHRQPRSVGRAVERAGQPVDDFFCRRGGGRGGGWRGGRTSAATQMSPTSAPPPQTPFFDPAVAATPATGLQQPVLVTPAAFQPRAAAAANPVAALSAPAGNRARAGGRIPAASPGGQVLLTAVAAVKEIKGIAAADQELDGEEAIGIVSRIIENTAALKNLPGILNMTFWKQTRAVARSLWSKEHGDETPAAMTRRFSRVPRPRPGVNSAADGDPSRGMPRLSRGKDREREEREPMARGGSQERCAGGLCVIVETRTTEKTSGRRRAAWRKTRCRVWRRQQRGTEESRSVERLCASVSESDGGVLPHRHAPGAICVVEVAERERYRELENALLFGLLHTNARQPLPRQMPLRTARKVRRHELHLCPTRDVLNKHSPLQSDPCPSPSDSTSDQRRTA